MKPKTGPHYFSDRIDYNLQGTTAIITPRKASSDILRLSEVWGLSYYDWLTNENSIPVDKILFDISKISISHPESESFIRRISYLNLNNPFKLDIFAKQGIVLHSKHELENRPSDEVIIDEFKLRTSDDTPGRLEKDFQAFLFGDSILKKAPNTPIDYRSIYRRLGVLGSDFYNLKKDYKLIREFPTGVFLNNKSNANRLLPTYYVDLVAFNKHRELSFIELKLNDTKLHVLSQLLDYALFALGYKKQIVQSIEKHIGKLYYPSEILNKPIACYVANNLFHPKFDQIKKYYSPIGKGLNMKFNKIVLGDVTSF